MLLSDMAGLSQGELWRLLSCHTFFSTYVTIRLSSSTPVAYSSCSTPQVFVSLALVYTCRQFERQMGTRKFDSFLFSSYAITTLVQVAYLTILASLGSYPRLATGPFFYVFSLLPLFHSKYCRVMALLTCSQSISPNYIPGALPSSASDSQKRPGCISWRRNWRSVRGRAV